MSLRDLEFNNASHESEESCAVFLGHFSKYCLIIGSCSSFSRKLVTRIKFLDCQIISC